MFKTLDILIGATTVILVFSMAVTVVTQAITAFFGRRGKHLLAGLSDLLQQLGIDDRACAEEVSAAVLSHPLIAGANQRLGSVIQREEFTKLLLDLATDTGAAKLKPETKGLLVKMLQNNGVADPGAMLKQIRQIAVQIEAANPALANDVRQTMAILRASTSDYVARINAWFDQSMDRVSERFTRYTHVITILIATIVVLVVQLDTIAVIDRLSIDDKFRDAFVAQAVTDYSNDAKAEEAQSPEKKVSPKSYYNMLDKSGLISMPSGNWLYQMSDIRKYPGMLLSILLISLGAPFWYNVLKDLIGLRSSLAKKDDVQRVVRQTSQDVGPVTAVAAVQTGTPPDR